MSADDDADCVEHVWQFEAATLTMGSSWEEWRCTRCSAVELTRPWSRIRAHPYHPHTGAVPVEPGVIEEYVVRLYPFAATFLPGHRLVVELSNDEPLADEHNALLPPDAFHLPVGRPVTHRVYRDAEHPSRLVLPFTT